MVGKIGKTSADEVKLMNKFENYGSNQKLNTKMGKVYHFSKVSGVANRIVLCEMINSDMLKAKVESRMVVKVPNLGMSIIGGKAQKRKELMYVNLRNLDYSTETTADEYVQ